MIIPVFDTEASASTATGTTVTINITIGANNNRMLIVGSQSSSGAYVQCTGVTIVGYSLTLSKRQRSGGAQTAEACTWYLADPPTGAQTVTVTFASNASFMGGGAISYYSVSGLGSSASASGSDTTPTVDISSNIGELVVDSATSINYSSVGAGQTQRYEEAIGGVWGGGSTEPGAPTVTMSWTNSNSHDWAICAIGLKPINEATTFLLDFI